MPGRRIARVARRFQRPFKSRKVTHEFHTLAAPDSVRRHSRAAGRGASRARPVGIAGLRPQPEHQQRAGVPDRSRRRADTRRDPLRWASSRRRRSSGPTRPLPTSPTTPAPSASSDPDEHGGADDCRGSVSLGHGVQSGLHPSLCREPERRHRHCLQCRGGDRAARRSSRHSAAPAGRSRPLSRLMARGCTWPTRRQHGPRLRSHPQTPSSQPSRSAQRRSIWSSIHGRRNLRPQLRQQHGFAHRSELEHRHRVNGDETADRGRRQPQRRAILCPELDRRDDLASSTPRLSPLAPPISAGGNNAFGLALTPDGSVLYATNEQNDSIALFSVGATGALTSLGTQAVGLGDSNPFGFGLCDGNGNNSCGPDSRSSPTPLGHWGARSTIPSSPAARSSSTTPAWCSRSPSRSTRSARSTPMAATQRFPAC